MWRASTELRAGLEGGAYKCIVAGISKCQELVEIYRLLEGGAWNVQESNPGVALSKVGLWFI